ncbi:VacJ [Paludibacterium paludis]|uniref:VacJ n=1 Tax=Paludibacterium paludis TaxID=1225769 RepID=A0A918U8F7_9NEIS|nr:VacJ [Paludibacterium paludis]GGY09828.1 hypothetical protein GCM10011289_10900 [Paludibacterium paludis]
MFEVNRSVAVLRPTTLFHTWLTALPGGAGAPSLDVLRAAGNAMLIPPADDTDDARGFVLTHWAELFEAELADWCEDTAAWPAARSEAMFAAWFDIDIHPVLTDLVKEPLEREAFIPLDLDSLG